MALLSFLTRRPAKEKVVAIVGPTGSGKTELAISLAKKFNGVLIGADSRQIYKRLNIATAKPTKAALGKLPHYMLDIAEPDEEFTVTIYQSTVYNLLDRLARENTRRSLKTLPILVGGTGLYIKAVINGLQIPRVPPNKDLRSELEQKSLEELQRKLLALDPTANVDLKNKRRIIRALEIVLSTGQPLSQQRGMKPPANYEFLQIAPEWPRDELYRRINQRIDSMMTQGLLEEARELWRAGYDFSTQAFTALGYEHFKRFFEKKITKAQAVELMKRDHRRYARRQLSWFRRDKRIHWVKAWPEAEKLVAEFVKN